MNKTLIKNFAIDARVRLIQMAIDNAGLVGIAKDKITEAVQKGADFEIYKTAAGTDYTITGKKIKQRKNLAERINKIGFEQVMEETAYTWFNRIIAIRYMEVNDYLPSRVRVLSSETAGKKEPDIITMAPDNVDLNFTSNEKDLIRDLKAKQKMDEAFQILFIKQCNELNKELPKLFEKTTGGPLDYTELLFNLSFTRTDGVLARLLEIDEEDFKDQVQIIGWMYQAYITELNEKVYDGTLSKAKISKELLPAATQLFTPDWPIRYMVENSLGKLLLNSANIKNDVEYAKMLNWKYYLPQAEQTEEVKKQLEEINKTKTALEQVKFLDPCMGSGHILVYAFDLFIQMYKNAGYNERDAAEKVMQNNIFGLDIDDRAAQLAYFALMMKGRQYDRRFLEKGITPNVFAIHESNGISAISIEKVITDKEDVQTANYIIETFKDAKEYGSILDVSEHNWDSLKEKLEAWKKDHDATLENVLVESDVNFLLPLIEQARTMSYKYDVVVTNPPYLGSGRFSQKLETYVKAMFPMVKADLSMVVFKHSIDALVKKGGYVAFITTSSWMFISSFKEIRNYILDNYSFSSICDFGTELFEGKVGHNPIVAWVNRAINISDYKSICIRLVDYCFSRRDEKPIEFHNHKNWYYPKKENYKRITGNPIAYWVSENFFRLFNSSKIFDFAIVQEGLKTGDNNRFIRLWYEIDVNKSNVSNYTGTKWIYHTKGGEFRRWEGNRIEVLNYESNGKELSEYKSASLAGYDNYFKECITYNRISSSMTSFRYAGENCIPNMAGLAIYPKNHENIYYLLAWLNTKIIIEILSIINPTINFPPGTIGNLPCDSRLTHKDIITTLSKENVSISKTDWDSDETSWDFTVHPLIPKNTDFKDKAAISIKISDCFEKWQKECEERFTKLKGNEEELNRIFIEIYGLQDELTPEVEDKDVTVRHANRKDDIKSFVSYAVGCMFGRYSLSKPGLIYAGGDFDLKNYQYFIPDSDNVIPITDEEYFKDDIVSRFVEFVAQVYGTSTLEENLKYIADSLETSGATARECIRNYFLNDFYTDHCKTYSTVNSGKRPIYWMFDSGKENGFKALIYLHRYDNQTVARVRTSYLHELQKFQEAALVQCQQIIDNPATSAHDKANTIKRQTKITKQLAETRLYDQAMAHIASQLIELDLDDGVIANYEKFQGVQVAREGQKAIKVDLLAKRG